MSTVVTRPPGGGVVSPRWVTLVVGGATVSRWWVTAVTAPAALPAVVHRSARSPVVRRAALVPWAVAPVVAWPTTLARLATLPVPSAVVSPGQVTSALVAARALLATSWRPVVPTRGLLTGPAAGLAGLASLVAASSARPATDTGTAA